VWTARASPLLPRDHLIARLLIDLGSEQAELVEELGCPPDICCQRIRIVPGSHSEPFENGLLGGKDKRSHF
jgi:hypothetical protein